MLKQEGLLLAMIIVVIMLVIVSVLFCMSLIIGYDQIIVSRVPFRRLSRGAIIEIFTTLQVQPKAIVYDLGCGDGRVLIEAAKIQPKPTYIGVEKAIIPFLLAKYRTRHLDQIQIHLGDIRRFNFTNATHVFVYLLPNLLEDLEPNLNTIINNKKHIIAVEFPLKTAMPSKTYVLKSKSKFASTWYVY